MVYVITRIVDFRRQCCPVSLASLFEDHNPVNTDIFRTQFSQSYHNRVNPDIFRAQLSQHVTHA